MSNNQNFQNAGTPIDGNVVFGRDTCPYCIKAKNALGRAGISYSYRNVEEDADAKQEMMERVKPILGSTARVTVPQIWLKGKYVGGYQQLSEMLEE